MALQPWRNWPTKRRQWIKPIMLGTSVIANLAVALVFVLLVKNYLYTLRLVQTSY